MTQVLHVVLAFHDFSGQLGETLPAILEVSFVVFDGGRRWRTQLRQKIFLLDDFSAS
jgi:hypothetical protein